MTKPLPDSPRKFPWLPAALALAAILFLFFWLQFATPVICCGDFDGYYHIHWSLLLWQSISHGHLPAFSWLPLTSLNAHDYADQQFLFHLGLIPLLWFATPVSAAKISAALLGAAAVFSCFWLVLRYRIRYAAFWLLALLGSSSFFLYRMSMTRAQSISLLFIVAGIVVLFEEKYRWLAPLAFLYVWTYNLFVILAAMALLWTAALWWTERRRELRPVLWTAIGIAAGFVVNPYFPHDLRLFAENLIAKTGALTLQTRGGVEWLALPTWDLVTSSAVALLAMLAGYITVGFLLGRQGRSGMQRPIFFLLFATLLLLLAAHSRRFLEYWPSCAVLFAAFALQSAWEQSPLQTPRANTRKLQATLATVAIAAAFVYEVHGTRQLIAATENADKYSAGAQWLSQHAPSGATIFNAEWDDFPILFYNDDAHAYVSGLDPIYLADHSPDLAQLYERIVAGKQNRPGEYVHNSFGADYVFVNPADERNFYVAAMLSGQFTKVYEDPHCTILKVRDLTATDTQ